MKRRMVVVLSAAVIALPACAQVEAVFGIGGPDGPRSGPVVRAPEPEPHGDPPGAFAEQVEPRPGMAGVRARGFDHVEVSEDGRTLTIYFWSGVEPCAVLDRVEVDEREQVVEVTLYEGHDPEAGEVACIMIAVYKAVEVSLAQPLGSRTVVDGSGG